MKVKRRKGRFFIKPLFRRYGAKPKKGDKAIFEHYWYGRQARCGVNIGSFYSSLAQGIFDGENLYNGVAHHNQPELDYETPARLGQNYRPDLLIRGRGKEIHGEVKAVAVSSGRAWFGSRQLANICRSFLENPCAEHYALIFKYGDSKEKKYLGKTEKGWVRKAEMLKRLGEKGLIEKLSTATRGLVIIPHNLLMFLAASSPILTADQATSLSCRDNENYYRILGRYITLLQKHVENPKLAIDEILSCRKGWMRKKKKKETIPDPRLAFKGIELPEPELNPLEPFKLEDFFLGGLSATQVQSPKNIFCNSYRYDIRKGKARKVVDTMDVKFEPVRIRGYGGKNSFPITIYGSSNLGYWRRHFKDNLEYFLQGLGLEDVWKQQDKYLGDVARRAAIAEKQKLPKKPKDNIPF